MKKHGLRIALFILSFTIGIGFVWLLNLSNNTRPLGVVTFDDAIIENDSIPVKTRNGDIEIKFREFVKTKDGLYADVEVLNPETESVYFYDVLSNNDDTLTLFEPSVKIDGKEAEMMTCSFGKTYVEKKLGYSRTFRIYLNVIISYWEKGKSFQIGLHFKKSTDKLYNLYWSENLPITDLMAKQLLKEQNRKY
ncbi:MAG: hypothetical protein ABJA66_10135 [Actinomycetota bacterium]